MYIAIFREPAREIQNAEELRTALKSRHDATFGAFWLWHQKDISLAILINGEDAYVDFFPEAGHPGWWASGRDGDDEILFLAENYEPTPMNRRYTIATAQAEQAAVEFLETAQRPTCVEWVEL